MATVNLTKDTFEDTVASNDVVLVDFWAEWCGPCRVFGPIFEAASEKHDNIVFAKVDTEDQQELAGYFNIRSIPTLMVFREQVMLFNQPGALPENALDSLIEQVEALDMDDIRQQIAENDESEPSEHEHSHAQ